MATTRPKGEFERIAAYFAPLAAGFPGAFGLLDDAAVLAPGPGEELVVTTDTIVAGVHFIGDELPELIARKLLRVNLSDLAAKGSNPLAYTLNIALPGSIGDDWLARFAEGLRVDQAEYGIHLIGGDSVSTGGPVTLTVTAFGAVAKGKIVRRSGARAGDGVFVSGTIGDAALGLAVLQGRLATDPRVDTEFLIDRYRLPRPRVELGRRLSDIAHAAADVSDGLVADLGHIAESSGLAATIDSVSLPLSPAAATALKSHPNLLVSLLTGGDDYELIFTLGDPADLKTLSADTGVLATRIGRMEAGAGVTVLGTDGRVLPLRSTGFRHA